MPLWRVFCSTNRAMDCCSTHRPKSRRSLLGFTVAEVTVAGAILALFVSTSVAAMTQINRWAASARLRTLALALAQQKVDQILSTPWSVLDTTPTLFAVGTTNESNLPLNNDAFNSETGLSSAVHQPRRSGQRHAEDRHHFHFRAPGQRHRHRQLYLPESSREHRHDHAALHGRLLVTSMRRTRSAFTLIEMMVAMAIFAMVSLALFSFTSTSLRLVARNLATNHSHQWIRLSDQQLLHDLHNSASAFVLVNYNGTTYSDVTPSPTSDVDAGTQQNISNRANGVRFRLLGGGPYQLTANTTSTSANLTFNFGVSGAVPYVPEIGDKVVFPLLSGNGEFDISAIVTTPTVANPTGVVTISAAGGIGFTINTTTAGNVTTAYFYREVAYTVYGNMLRYHPNYTSTYKGTYMMVQNNITSPQPFALLFPSGSTTTTGLNLRLSLESYDTSYSARQYNNGTTTPPDGHPRPRGAHPGRFDQCELIRDMNISAPSERASRANTHPLASVVCNPLRPV